jgi:hypothetical protein
MTLLKPGTWEIVSSLAVAATAAACAVWWFRRRRPTADEIEQARRALLAHEGRLVDGMLLDVCEMESTDARTLTLLVYNYRIGGVDYECSQDVTTMREIVNPAEVRVGFPCSVRYHQRNPQNSIIVAEEWSGLRDGLPQLRNFSPLSPDKQNQQHPLRG